MESSVTVPQEHVVRGFHMCLFAPTVDEIPAGCYAEQKPGAIAWAIIGPPASLYHMNFKEMRNAAF